VRCITTRFEIAYFAKRHPDIKVRKTWKILKLNKPGVYRNPMEFFLFLSFGAPLIMFLLTSLCLLVIDIRYTLRDSQLHPIPLALFALMTLVGYGVPDALLCWNRHGQEGLYPSTWWPLRQKPAAKSPASLNG
jgi:hypothetical protein